MRKLNWCFLVSRTINFNILPKFCFSSNIPKSESDKKSASNPSESTSLQEKEEESEKHLTEELSDKHKIILTEDPSKLMDDYTESPTMLKFKEDSLNEFYPYQSSTGFNLNTKSELQLKDNPLALQILTEGKIDLKHKNVKLENSNIQDLSFYSVDDLKVLNNNMAQINVGEIDVLPKNSILLEDVDVYNVPEDKDIILNSNRKNMVVVGHKINKTVLNKEFDENTRGEFHVSKNIFEELNYEEFKKKYLFEFESKNVKFHKNLFFREIFRFWPLIIFMAYFIDTVLELYQTKRDDNLIETQEIEIFNKIREKYMKDILLTNDLYNRMNYK